uniref:Uncharacterized protein n=1 Tax=Solanum lycopersicum TaxID=4081 RepID=A0A3Q7H5B7_SOLLC
MIVSVLVERLDAAIPSSFHLRKINACKQTIRLPCLFKELGSVLYHNLCNPHRPGKDHQVEQVEQWRACRWHPSASARHHHQLQQLLL